MAFPLPARVVLGLGLVGLVVAVINQLSAPQLDPSLERASVLASFLAVGLMVVATLWQRVVPEPAQRAELEGREGCELAEGLPEDLVRELGWGSSMLLTATPAAILVIHDGQRTLLRRGLIGPEAFTPGAICQQALGRQRAISLVDLRLYPGRAEFDGLLRGVPAVVVQPIHGGAVLVVGGWSPRCFSAADLCWIDGWARKLRTQWAPVCGEPAPAAAARPDGEAAPG